MPRKPANRALMEMVDQLARATPDDVAAILALLDGDSAAKLRALLAGDVAAATPRPSPIRQIDTSALSPWLAARVLGEGVAGEASRVTGHTASTLRQIVAAMPGFQAPAATKPRRSLLHRLFLLGSGA